GARLGSDPDDLDARALPVRSFRRSGGDAVLAQRPAAFLVALHPLLAPLQRALLLLEHGVQRGLGVRVLRLSRQIETVSEYAELRQMAVALLGHGQLRADQVREVPLQLLVPPLRVLAVVGSHLPVPPLDRDLHRVPLIGSSSTLDP